MSPSKHRLRRSCVFCRARKIKCSNEAICDACRKQGADCIYDFEITRSKASTGGQDRGHELSSTPPGASHLSTSGYSPSSLDLRRRRRRRRRSQGTSFGRGSSSMAREGAESVAAILEHTFFDNLAPDGRYLLSQPRAPSSSERMQMKAEHHEQPITTLSPSSLTEAMPSTPLLSLIVQDLVGLVASQFSALGCHHVETGQAHFFLSGLIHDKTEDIFDDYDIDISGDKPSGMTPLAEIGRRQQTQLIDVWYSTHPLSFTVSKTLLLRELRDGTHDDILLAAILGHASAQTAHVSQGRSLMTWAASQLRLRQLHSVSGVSHGAETDDSTPVFSALSTRIFNELPTVQALVLLGWDALVSAQMRRATCYIGLAGAIITDLKEQISTDADPKASSRINGIDVFDVERELIDHLYWTTYSICLWAFVQTGNQQFAPPLPAAQPAIFVPPTEENSAVIRLDRVSDNFNTLHAQTIAIRETWPLAHIASIVAYACTFYPRSSDRVPGLNSLSTLQTQRLDTRGQPWTEMDVACHEVLRVLSKSITHLDDQIYNAESRSIVLIAYHTLLIHFLFPLNIKDPSGLEVIEKLCSSADALLKGIDSFTKLSQQRSISHYDTPRSLLSELLILGIDSCSRAYESLLHRQASNPGLVAVPSESLIQSLYHSTKHETLPQTTTLRAARRRLKDVIRSFHLQNPAQSPPSPTRGEPNTTKQMIVENTSPSYITQPATELDNPFAVYSTTTPHHPNASSPRPSASASMGGSPDSDHLSQASTAALDGKLTLSPPSISHKGSSPIIPGPSISTLQRPLTLPSTTLSQPTGVLLSPGDVFKTSWQPMMGHESFDNANLPKHNSMSITAQPVPNMVHNSLGLAVNSGSVMLHSTQWMPQLPPELMMDIDPAPDASWGDWPNSNSIPSTDEPWSMGIPSSRG